MPIRIGWSDPVHDLGKGGGHAAVGPALDFGGRPGVGNLEVWQWRIAGDEQAVAAQGVNAGGGLLQDQGEFENPSTMCAMKGCLPYRAGLHGADQAVAIARILDAFTRLVCAFTAPVGYLFRPYIVYRSRQGGPATRPARRGWERIG